MKKIPGVNFSDGSARVPPLSVSGKGTVAWLERIKSPHSDSVKARPIQGQISEKQKKKPKSA